MNKLKLIWQILKYNPDCNCRECAETRKRLEEVKKDEQ